MRKDIWYQTIPGNVRFNDPDDPEKPEGDGTNTIDDGDEETKAPPP
jgi:hypothetical protein